MATTTELKDFVASAYADNTSQEIDAKDLRDGMNLVADVVDAVVAAINVTLAAKAPLDSPLLTGVPKVPTAAPGTDTLQAASTAFVKIAIEAAIEALIASAPGALDTLNELAAALGDDPDFATTVTNLLATKAPLVSPALTGTPTGPTAPLGTDTTQLATTAFVQRAASIIQAAMIIAEAESTQRDTALTDLVREEVERFWITTPQILRRHAKMAFPFTAAGGQTVAYFDPMGQLHADFVGETGTITLSPDYSLVRCDQNGLIGAATPWLDLSIPDADPMPTLSSEWRFLRLRDDGHIEVGERWDGSELRKANGDMTLGYRWTETSEDGLVMRGIELDGKVQTGPRTEIDWIAYLSAGDVWIAADAYDPVQITHSGDVLAVRLEGLALDVVRDAGVTRYYLWGGVDAPDTVTTIHHVPGSGQSVSVGFNSQDLLTGENPDPRLLMPNGGIRTLGNIHHPSLTDMALAPERVSGISPARETQIGTSAETPASGIGLEFIQGIAATEAALVSLHGIGSNPYQNLKKGTQPYANILIAVERLRVATLFSGRDYTCDAVFWDQGEGNIGNSAAQRIADLEELQADLTADINAITGGTGEVVLIACQTSSAASYGYSLIPGTPIGQLHAALNNPTKIICPGPKYQHPYNDTAHTAAVGCKKYGEEVGRMRARLLNGEDTQPFYAMTAVRSGNTVTVTFSQPDDTTWEVNEVIVSNPGNYGLSWHDNGDGNSVDIDGGTPVDVSTPWQAVITLTDTPTGTGQQIGIAATTPLGGELPGPTSGMRSNFCAVTAQTHYDGSSIRMWACHDLIDVTT